MNKEQRMKNTDYYEFTNVNPKNKFVGDCVIRAIALACGQSWEKTVREMTELGIKKGLVLNDVKLFPLYLKAKGFNQEKEPRDCCNRKMTIKERIIYDATELSDFRKNVYVVNVGSHHVTCIVDGKVRDIWDSSKQTMHKYWWKRG